jgi:type IV pilus assembly protein PilQ
MTLRRGIALILTVAAAGALVNASAPADGPAAAGGARLKAISSRVSQTGASLVIEASDPVGYVASYPDPLTVVLDFRGVAAEGVANSVAASAKNPIARVTVEPTELAGAVASRVRVTLTEPVGHHVRAERNTIVVDFDKTAGASAAVITAAGRSTSPVDAMTAIDPQTVRLPDPITALGLDKTPVVARSQAPAARAAATPVTISSTGQEQPTGAKKYSGSPISLDLQGADLRAVLRSFSEISGLNMVIDPAVNGTVDVALRDVPWDQALDIILTANKLGYVVDGTIVRIAPLGTLADEQTQKRKLDDEKALAGDLVSQSRRVSYAKAADLEPLINKQLSQRGTFTMDPRTNTIIVRDLEPRVQAVMDLISLLDLPQPQVEIEARIVQTSKNFARQLGIQWGFNGQVSPALGNQTPFAFPNNGQLNGAAVGLPGTPANTAVSLPVPGPSGVHLALGSINGAFNLDATLTALESTGNGRILSTPRVTTQNNVAAEMTQGTQIPIQTSANNTVSVTFKDAALKLLVTPQITAAGTVIMLINLENSQPDFTRAVNGTPPINTQRAVTTVLVADGQTTVIGGVFVTNEQTQQDRTPGLGTIPLIKWLFKRDVNSTVDQELLIFVTPRIVKL